MTTAEKMAAWRRRSPDGVARQRAASRARHRAFVRLAAMFADEFRELEDEERETEGLPPVGEASVGRPPKLPA